MAIMDAIRDFIKTKCPYLDEFNHGIGVDYLGEQIDSYVLEHVPVNPVIKRYIDGTSERQVAFVFASREAYGPDTIQNLENIEFFEHVAEWMEDCTRSGNLPDLGPDKQALELRTEATPFLMINDEDLAIYQIQCKLIYFNEKVEETKQ